MEKGITSEQPTVFVSHGSPMTALDKGAYGAALAKFGGSVKPKAIALISAHWQEPGIRIASGARPGMIYDFGGFPRQLYELKYDAPGSPDLAEEIAARMKDAGFDVQLDETRGWDHGVWVPLRLMFPAARIPVVEVSLPTRWTPQQLHKIGQALSGLRTSGVLIMGSGGIVHNLHRMNWRDKNATADPWAQDFQSWVKARVGQHDLESLFRYESQAPHARWAVPTAEHFAPLFPVVGAAGAAAELVPIFEGIEHGNMSMFSFEMVG